MKNKKPVVIAVVGMAGSGKSEVVKVLEEKGFKRFYFGGIVVEATKKKYGKRTEQLERKVRLSLRKKYGMAAMALLSLDYIQQDIESGKNVVIDGLYSWDEFKILKEKFKDSFYLISVHLDFKTRAKRIVSRAVRPYSTEDLQKRDYSEIEESAKGGPIAYGDFHYVNSHNLKHLQEWVNKLTTKLSIS